MKLFPVMHVAELLVDLSDVVLEVIRGSVHFLLAVQLLQAFLLLRVQFSLQYSNPLFAHVLHLLQLPAYHSQELAGFVLVIRLI